ncbi:hypothetical protein SKAU_G00208270 [Synaphobranchus kaupii]|uniref:Uncharacterized protein n=1 Tax=Synaphobranchus kaupii TaxID=118154 RepID=A0A9Q1F8I5_SYNKA|nr:hypothetical protein SKAU_G00208270 [Synaphobranchus kaupii]
MVNKEYEEMKKQMRELEIREANSEAREKYLQRREKERLQPIEQEDIRRRRKMLIEEKLVDIEEQARRSDREKAAARNKGIASDSSGSEKERERDLQNLITTLPDIQEGAAIWIRKLEEEMTGKTMALGDVKALLTKVVGKEKMLDLIENAGYRGADKSTVDGRIFDQYRQKIWDSLRKAYPTRPSTAMLKGVPMKEEESAAAFVENQLRNWRMTLDKDIQGDPIMTAMFRAAILEGLPDLAKRRLEEVVGLSSMTHREFVDHVIHAVERGRMEEKKQSNQEREVQLEVLKNKEKSKTKEKDNDPKKIAPIMADFTWAEPEPPLPERGRGPSGSQPTVVYNFSGIPPSAVPMPVIVGAYPLVIAVNEAAEEHHLGLVKHQEVKTETTTVQLTKYENVENPTYEQPDYYGCGCWAGGAAKDGDCIREKRKAEWYYCL